MTSAQLVPPNATFLERVMDDLASRISDVPADVISTIWDPETCPPDALPFLAWGLSVDFWNPEWTEQTKREVVANSYQVHATKGTVGALKRALGPLGMRVALREWWEHGGEPHTFGLTATILPGAPATEGVQRDLIRIVTATKPARSHLTDLQMAVEFGQGLGIAAAGQGSDVGTRAGLAQGRSGLFGAVAMVGVVTPIQQRDSGGQVGGRQRLFAEAQLATALVAETGTDGRGMVAGRNTLLGDAAIALVADGSPSSEGTGRAAGRMGLEVAAPLVAAMTASHTVEAAMPSEEPEEIMAQRIVLSGASFPDMTITAVDGALVLIQNGKTTYLTGRPARPDIQQVGLVNGVAGASAVTFSGVPGVLVAGDRLILDATWHTVQSVAGSTLNINPPLAADMDGIPALRFREGV